jgi:hypothetical protein
MAIVTRSLATLFNAQRIADHRHDADGHDWAVLETGNPEQPYTVAPYAGQGEAVSLSTSRTATALDFANAPQRLR